MAEYGAVAPRSVCVPDASGREATQRTDGLRITNSNILALIGCVLIIAVVASSGPTPQPTASVKSTIAAGQMLHEKSAKVAAHQAIIAKHTQRLDSAPPPAAATPATPLGSADELQKSINDAINQPATDENSHYVAGYSDKEVHLLVALALLLGTVTIYFAWRTQRKLNERAGLEPIPHDDRHSAPPPRPVSSGGKPGPVSGRK